MKRQFLTLSIVAALTACGGSDNDEPQTVQTPPDMSGDFAGIATKAESATGVIVVRDINVGESLVYPATTVGTYGSFFINAAGEWEYTLDRANEAVEALVSADMPSLVEAPFSFTTADGTTATVSIVIDGIDVPATFSGALTFSIFTDKDSNTATVRIRDENPAEAFFTPNQTPMATYGSVTFDSDTGAWTYNIDETNDAVKALNYTDALAEGELPPSLDDTFIITSLDGTEQVVTITIKGSQLIPATIEGLPEVDDAGVSAAQVNINSVDASGELTISDPNFGDESFQTQDAVATSYGTFSIDEAGVWTYELDATNADVIALKGDGTPPPPLSELITVKALDGTAVDIPITINGLVGGNLTAQIGGGTADSLFRINMPNNATQVMGKMTLKVNYAATGTKDAKITFFGRAFNSDDKRTMATMALNKAGVIKLMDGSGSKAFFALDQKHTPGEWFDVAFTWDARSESKIGGKPAISLSINGEPVTSAGGQIAGEVFPSLSIAGFIVAIGVKHMQVSTKGDSGPVNVDDYVIYSDIEGTNEIYRQEFDDLNEGAAIAIDLKNNATKGTIVGPLAKPE